MLIIRLILLLLCARLILSLNFNIDFQYPMTLDSSIKFIKTTPNGRTIIHFQNTNWNVYNTSFGLLTTFQVQTKLWADLQIYDDTYGAILNNQKNQVCFFNLTTYISSTCNTMTGIIGIQPLNAFSINYIATANQTNFIAFSFLFPLTLTSKNPLVSFNFVSSALGVWTVSNGSVYKISQKHLNYTYTLIYSHSFEVKLLYIMDNSIVFTQDLSNLIKAYNLSSLSLLNVSSNLYSSLSSIKKVGSNLMFIYNNEISYISYNTTTLQYEKTNFTIFNVSIPKLVIITTSLFSLAFVPQSNLIYSVSQCNGNNIYNGIQCVPVSCVSSLCISCPLSSSICSKCISPYLINPQFACILPTIFINQTINSTSNYTNLINNSVIDNNTSLNSSNYTVQNNSASTNYSTNLNISTQLNATNSTGEYNSTNSTGGYNSTNSTGGYNSTNSTGGYNSTNSTGGGYNSTNSTNSSSFIKPLNKNKICRFIQYLDSNNQCIVDQKFPVVNKILTFGKKINSISSIRVLVKIFTPLFSFYDDYWYYIYHLTPSDKSFSYLYLMELYNMNNQRLVPNFAPSQAIKNFVNLQNYHNVSNFDIYCPSTMLNVDNQNTYFMQILLPMILQNWVLSILIFYICRLLCKCFTSMILAGSYSGKSLKILKILSGYFEKTSLKGMIMISIFQANLIIISLRGTAQIFNHFSFSFIDKINLVLTNLVFCAFIVYALSFYFLVMKCSKNHYSNFLNDKKNSSQSFTLQVYLFGIKNLTSGIIHYLFIDSIYVFHLLFLLKFSLICICLKYKRFYKSQISMSLVVIYYLLGMIFDAFLIWNQPLIAKGQVSDILPATIIQQGCLVGFLIIIFIKIAFDAAFQLKQWYQANRKEAKTQQKQLQIIQSKNHIQNKITPINENFRDIFGDALIKINTQNLHEGKTKKKSIQSYKKSYGFKIKTKMEKKVNNRLKFTIVQENSNDSSQILQYGIKTIKQNNKQAKFQKQKQFSWAKKVPQKMVKMRYNFRMKKSSPKEQEQQVYK